MSDEIVLSFAAALDTVLQQARGGAVSGLRPFVETVMLAQAEGRVLAAPVVAERDQPPFDRSTRDGFAIRSADVASGMRTLHVVGSLRAGHAWQGTPLEPGQAIEIMTGAPLPPGADAVVMVEHVSASGATIEVQAGRQFRPGENVVPRAAEAREGASLLPTGRLIGAAEIAVAAGCGRASLEVFAKPRVAVVATGDELVELDAVPEPWQIRNSNSYALAALVRAEGGHAVQLPVALDTLADLRNRIERGREADLLLLSGGVSMGKYDLVEQVLREAGAESFFTGALIQPGKPIVFGRLPPALNGRTGTCFFGLPGNPVSTQVCFHLFVAPMLRALSGRSDLAPLFVEATLAADVPGGARVTWFLPAELESAWDRVSVRVVGWQGSGDTAANARGNCYCVLPPGVEAVRAGETVRVLLR